jgi:AraC-like DNA-binding protein
MKKNAPSLRVEFSEKLPPLYPIHLLYANRSLPTPHHKTNFHDHPFWQIEVVRKGRIECDIGAATITLSEGAVVVIPPRVSHRFYYHSDSEYFSFKFDIELSKLPELTGLNYLLPDNQEIKQWRDCLEGIFPSDLPASGPRARWLAYVLSALVQVFFHPETSTKPNTDSRPVLIDKVRGLVQKRQGQAVSVFELAGALAYSASHLSTIFKKEKGGSLKKFIDQERGKLIGTRLKYSDQTITDIASSLNFPSVLAFSHYCRRTLGKSPRAFRKSFILEK